MSQTKNVSMNTLHRVVLDTSELLCFRVVSLKTYDLLHNVCQTNLREVSDQVTAVSVNLSENVEEERFDVEVQSLVIKEELGQQTEVLTVYLQQ